MNRNWIAGSVAVVAVVLTGCTLTEQHTAGGALTGAAIGSLATGNPRGALIGAMAGGAIGNVHGQNMQRDQNTNQRMNQMQQQMNQTTVWVSNSNGSRTPVTLSKALGGQWIGPRGEVYSTLPSEDQLKSVYGF